jgi:hypothetical protein
MAGEKDVKINNTQRRELGKIADRIIDDRIRVAMEEAAHQKSIARKRAEEELGASELDMQIEALSNEIKELEAKKEELGFGRYDHIIPGSRADSYTREFLRLSEMEVGKLKSLKDTAKQKLWASETVNAAESILEKVKKL